MGGVRKCFATGVLRKNQTTDGSKKKEQDRTYYEKKVSDGQPPANPTKKRVEMKGEGTKKKFGTQVKY